MKKSDRQDRIDLNQYVTRTGLIKEYKLTREQVQALGEPDLIRPNIQPYNTTNIYLYERARVLRWIEEQPDIPRNGETAQHIADSYRKTRVIHLLADLIKQFTIHPLPPLGEMEQEVVLFAYHQEGKVQKKAPLTGLIALIRHSYTNYNELIESLNKTTESAELYKYFKIYVCQCILEVLGLKYDAVPIALPEMRDEWPDLRKNYKTLYAQMQSDVPGFSQFCNNHSFFRSNK